MKKCNSRKGWGIRVLSVFVLMLAFCLPVSAGVQEGEGEYEIYPTPQDIVYGDGTVTLTDQINVTYGDAIDEYTKTRVSDTLEVLELEQSATSVAANTNLIVGVYGESGDPAAAYGASHSVDASIYEKYDAYTLWVQGKNIVILGKNTDAAYYGVTTLKRIFEQIADKGEKSVRELTVKDYAEIQFRGFIEGYYGNPWSHEDRIDLMKFGGEIKMNQYVFAPKDDPYHNARWRELYPEEDLEKIRELAQAGNESKCFYVYALHTFMSNPINFTSEATYQADLQVIKDKFAQVIEAGVRQIAVLEDDTSGTSANNIIKLMMDLNAWLKEIKASTYPDLKTDILYCPAEYGSTTNSKLTAVHKGVSEEIHIVMTGGKVWGQVSNQFADGFYNGLNSSEKEGRYPYMWVNWPCNDNTKTSQVMGGHNYILEPGLDGNKYEGIILNPIQESESSKVGIFTAADYCWNIWDGPGADDPAWNLNGTGFKSPQGDQAWEDSFKYIDHMSAIETEESTALREVAKHMITQGPDQTVPGKQVQFDESLEIKEQIIALKNKIVAGTIQESDKAAIEALKKEFEKIRDAAALYLERGTNRRTARQMTPFFSCLRDMTAADVYLLDGILAHLQDNDGGVWEGYAEGQALYDQSKSYGFFYYRAGTIYAMAARKYITPFTNAAVKYLSDAVKPIVAPDEGSADEGEFVKYTGTLTKSSNLSVYGNNVETRLTDGDDDTYVWYQYTGTPQKSEVGAYLQFDLGDAKPVGRVRILVGADNGDKWTKYHLEYSVDGQSWNKFGVYNGVSSGKDIYEVNLKGASARYIKLVNNQETSSWLKFSEFSIYSSVKAMEYTNTEDAEWQVEHADNTFKILPKQNAVLQPGQYIGLKLDRIRAFDGGITLTGSGMENLTLQKSMNGTEWTTGNDKGGARYIRLINQTQQDVTFNLESLTAVSNEIQPMDLYETNIGGSTLSDDARYLGTTKNWMDGNLGTAAKYSSTPRRDDYVTYDLGQEIELHTLKVYALDSWYDYPRDAVIEASLDKTQWTEILTIGDGIEDGQDTKDTAPSQNGWRKGGLGEEEYAYLENTEIPNVKARYIRLRFIAPYSYRWVELNEIAINQGEYIPSINDPTFETDAALQKGLEPQNLNDGDLTTGFQPDGTNNGYVIYNLSDKTQLGRINILQSGNVISNAKVSVRTGENTWKELGTLDRSFSAFYTGDLENVYAVKLEWQDAVPIIYEIITLENEGNVLEKNLNDAKEDLKKASDEVTKAEAAVSEIDTKIQTAVSKVNSAANTADKLRAEVELQKLYAEKAEAEAVVLRKKVEQTLQGAKADRVEARNKRVEAAATTDTAKKEELENQASNLEAGADVAETQTVQQLKNQAEQKDKEKEKYTQAATDKQTELDNFLKNPPTENPGGDKKPEPNPNPSPNPTPDPRPNPIPTPVKDFTYKNVKYKVLNASAKTVAAVGVQTKKVKSVTINTAKEAKSGVTYKVVQINDKAFKGCKKLTKVTIGNNVKKIGKEAFAQCTRLKTINMKKASGITSIGKKAFTKIQAKAKITVPAKKLKKYKKLLKKAGVPKKAVIKK